MVVALDPAGDAERLVHGQEAAVAVDQRKADRQHFEQRLDIGRAGEARRLLAVEQQQGPRPAVAAADRAARDRRAAARAGSPSATRWSRPSSAVLDEVGEAQRLVVRRRAADGAVGERLLAASTLPVVVDQRREHARRRQPLAGRARRRAWRRASAVGLRRHRESATAAGRRRCRRAATSTATPAGREARSAAARRSVAPRRRRAACRARHCASSSSPQCRCGGSASPKRAR